MQGSRTERKDSVQLTSLNFILDLLFLYWKYYFTFYKC